MIKNILSILFILLLSHFASAENISFRGNLINDTYCDIYDNIASGNTINVNFEGAFPSLISGAYYKEHFTINIKCHGINIDDSPVFLGYALKQGDVTDFDDNAIKTTNTGIGIKLYNQDNDNIISPGSQSTRIDIQNGEAQINLYAILVKAPSGAIEYGDFSATASIQLYYP